MLKDLVKQCRSYRRFYQDTAIPYSELADMVGSCMRSEIGRLLGLDPEHYSIDLVLALGKPKEEVVLVPVKEDGSTAYYRDGNQVHYVPKRSLEDILL